MTRSFRHRWLLAIPFAWQIGMVPLVNDVTWRPLGLPFPMAWQLIGIIVAALCIARVRALDTRVEAAIAAADADGERP